MTSNDFLQMANVARPDLIEKTAEAYAVLEAMAPEFVDELKTDMDAVLDRPSTHLEKHAGVGSSLYSGASSAAKIGLTAAGVGLGTAIAGDLYDAVRRSLTKGRNFKRIMDANPDLASKYDRKALTNSFSTFHRYAPEFTADPLLGGTILGAMAETPGNELTMIKTLIDSRKSLLEAKSKQFSLKIPGGKNRDDKKDDGKE